MQQLHFLFKFRDKFKNAEVLSTPEEREKLSIKTDSENVLSKLISSEIVRTIVINGSAGSGKTFLIQRIMDRVGDDVEFYDIDYNASSITTTKISCLVIKDITALDKEQIKRLVKIAEDNKFKKIVICVNFGPLLDYSRKYDGSLFSKSMEVLRKTRSDDYQDGLPTVMNLNDYRILSKSNLKNIFKTQYVTDLISNLSERSLIYRTWDQLNQSIYLDRFYEIISMANLVTENWSFRELWYFIEDLFDEKAPGHHSVYHRLFLANNKISRAMLKLCDPLNIPIGVLDDYCWFNDIDEIREELSSIIPLHSDTKKNYSFLKFQLLFLLEKKWLLNKIQTDTINSQRHVKRLVEKINKFSSFNEDESKNTLKLFVNSRIEIRDSKYPGFFIYGTISYTDLKLVRNNYILNCPQEIGADIEGTKLFLRAFDDNISYYIPPDFINELDKDNSLFYRDRSVTDLETSLELIAYKYLNEKEDEMMDAELISSVKKKYAPMNSFGEKYELED